MDLEIGKIQTVVGIRASGGRAMPATAGGQTWR